MGRVGPGLVETSCMREPASQRLTHPTHGPLRS